VSWLHPPNFRTPLLKRLRSGDSSSIRSMTSSPSTDSLVANPPEFGVLLPAARPHRSGTLDAAFGSNDQSIKRAHLVLIGGGLF